MESRATGADGVVELLLPTPPSNIASAATCLVDCHDGLSGHDGIGISGNEACTAFAVEVGIGLPGAIR